MQMKRNRLIKLCELVGRAQAEDEHSQLIISLCVMIWGLAVQESLFVTDLQRFFRTARAKQRKKNLFQKAKIKQNIIIIK